MSKPFDQFGGWLKFFFIVCWIGIVLNPFNLVLSFGAAINAKQVYLKAISLISCVSVLIALTFDIKTVKVLKVRSLETPQRVVNFLFIIISSSIAIEIIQLALFYFFEGVSGLNHYKDFGTNIVPEFIWYLIWTRYMRKSVRVKTYFGSNAV